MVPERHQKLIVHIRKMTDREKRKKLSKDKGKADEEVGLCSSVTGLVMHFCAFHHLAQTVVFGALVLTLYQPLTAFAVFHQNLYRGFILGVSTLYMCFSSYLSWLVSS